MTEKHHLPGCGPNITATKHGTRLKKAHRGRTSSLKDFAKREAARGNVHALEWMRAKGMAH